MVRRARLFVAVPLVSELRNNQYPSFSSDPVERQEQVWRRNAQMQGAKTEEEIEARVTFWREQRDRADEQGEPKEKKKR